MSEQASEQASICYHKFMEENGLAKIQSNDTSNAIYEKLLEELNKFADIEVEVKKTSLHISHGRAFIGVHPRKDGLLINIVTDSPLQSPRLKRSEKVSANRFHNEIIFGAVDELDEEVINWLKRAYALVSIQ